MRWLVLLLLIAPATARPDEQPLPKGVAAAHPQGVWKVRTADLYGHLVGYYAGEPQAVAALPDYLRRRMIEHEGRKRGITVTDKDSARQMARLDAQIRKRTGGTDNLEKYRKSQGMTKREFSRRMRSAILRERVARDIVNKRNKTRDPNKPLQESTIVLTIDELYGKSKKILDPKKLKKGIVAKIGGASITKYQYGRELSYTLPRNTVSNALNDLIIAEEVKILIGSDAPPTKEELKLERRWFITFEVNRLKRQAQAQGKGRVKIDLSTVNQVLSKRGLTVDKALGSPGSRAQARARGHFRLAYSGVRLVASMDTDNDGKIQEKEWTGDKARFAKLDANNDKVVTEDEGDASLRKYYETNRKRFGDKLRVATIFIAARAQRVGQIGGKVRTLPQGKALAEALHVRATQGVDFGELAKENSNDVDVIKNNGGLVPFWLTADTPGYTDVWPQADRLKEGTMSKPFFSRRGGFVIVKLLNRHKALGFDGMREKIVELASFEAYRTWRTKVLRAARKSKTLLSKD